MQLLNIEDNNLGLILIFAVLILSLLVFVVTYLIIRIFFLKKIREKINPAAFWAGVSFASLLIGCMILYLMAHP